ncbi:MAG: LTA synthase family protein [Vicinamibacteria bacterium]|nr:LTA synthase family protein [Vicinamibacteria bacterium]
MSKASRLGVALSLFATPVLLFVSTSVDVYLRNQLDFDLQAELLWPYLAACGLTVLLGAGLFMASRRPWAWAALWAYYLLGPLFLGYLLLRHVLWFLVTPPGLILIATLWLVGCFRLAQRHDPRRAAPLFAVLAVAWMTSDAWRFAGQRIVYQAPAEARTREQAVAAPNVYHLLFDEYDTRFFLRTLTPEVEHALRGFTFFRQALSTAGRTQGSLPAVFTGRAVHDEHAWTALNSDRSFVYWLRRAGYRTHGYLPLLWSFEQELFDRVHYHFPKQKVDHSRLFLGTWLAAHLPEAAWTWAGLRTWLTELAAKRQLPVSTPIASLAALGTAEEDEPQRPASGQYVFVHLLIPHGPYVLRSDCSVRPDITSYHPTAGSPIDQARCATARMVAWLELLERLGRLDDALVVIHADHGAPFDWSSGDPVWIPPQRQTGLELRSLLLVKAPGAPRDAPLRVSDAPVTLLDLAPTILARTGTAHQMELAGRPLPLAP